MICGSFQQAFSLAQVTPSVQGIKILEKFFDAVKKNMKKVVSYKRKTLYSQKDKEKPRLSVATTTARLSRGVAWCTYIKKPLFVKKVVLILMPGVSLSP